MDWIIYWTLFVWSVLGFLLLWTITETYPVGTCSFKFRLAVAIICGPVAWGLFIVFNLLYLIKILIKKKS